MSKVDISKVAEVIKKNQVEPDKIRTIIEELTLLTQPQDEEKEPAVKKQYAILVSDRDGVMPKQDLVGWVLQIEENESVATTQDRIIRTAYAFNATRKGQIMPVKSVGEALEAVGAKFFKEEKVWVRTKTPVLVLTTNNEIPKE